MPAATLGVLVLVALAAVAYFDFGPPTGFNDDALYAWPVKQLVAGHGFQVLPVHRAFALVGELWGLVFTLGHPDQRLLRLSVLPFTFLGAWGAYRATRALDGSREVAYVAAITLLGCPIYLALATSFMTDVQFVALELVTLAAALRWLRFGKSRWETVGWATLAVLQRQAGLSLAIAFIPALWLARRERVMSRSDWLAFDALLVGVGLAAIVPLLVLAAPTAVFEGAAGHSSPLAMRPVASFAPNQPHLLAPAFFAPTLGFELLPVAAILLPTLRLDGTRRLAWLAVTIVPAAISGWVFLKAGTVFPGDYLNPSGIGPPTLGGYLNGAGPGLVGLESAVVNAKAHLFPSWFFATICLASVFAWAVVSGAIIQRHVWRVAEAFLVLVVAVNLAGAVVTYDIDRYYLPAAAALIPLLLAPIAGPRARDLMGTAALVAAGIAIYVAGQQDYEAWHSAQLQALQLAYRAAPPNRVDGGDSNNGLIYAPAFGEGRLLDASDIVPNATFRLAFGAADDPRPGVVYHSLAPGKVILLPGPAAGG